jgi:hypothetical protein
VNNKPKFCTDCAWCFIERAAGSRPVELCMHPTVAATNPQYLVNADCNAKCSDQRAIGCEPEYLLVGACGRDGLFFEAKS